jgi:hypothetical protein
VWGDYEAMRINNDNKTRTKIIILLKFKWACKLYSEFTVSFLDIALSLKQMATGLATATDKELLLQFPEKISDLTPIYQTRT